MKIRTEPTVELNPSYLHVATKSKEQPLSYLHQVVEEIVGLDTPESNSTQRLGNYSVLIISYFVLAARSADHDIITNFD